MASSSSMNRPRARAAIPPLRPNRSTSGQGDIDPTATRERFDALLPKYGFLWRSMANAKLSSSSSSTKSTQRGLAVDKENLKPASSRNVVATPRTFAMKTNESNIAKKEKEVDEGPSLLDAILNKKAVTLSVPNQDHELCGDDCNCADPILEIDDENNSAFDASSVNDEGQIFGDSDDESVQLVSTRKASTRKKAFILESSDEEDDEEEDDEELDKSSIVSLQESGSNEAGNSKKLSTVIDELSDFNPSSGDESEDTSVSSERSVPIVTRRNPSRRTKSAISFSVKSDTNSDSDDDDEDKSSSSEEEWDGDMSFDEKEVKKPRAERVNTVIILSDDEEYESESESEVEDEQSAYTISDDDDDCSSESDVSDASSIVENKTKKTRPPPIRKNTKSPRIPRKKSAVLTTPKVVTKPTLSKPKVVNFNKSRDKLTSETFAEFNQLAFANQLSSVKVEWSKKLNTTAGITRMKGKLGEKYSDSRVATIELATKVIENEEQLRSTLLHEMCHAAAWLVDGVHKPPHGKVFKNWASKSMRKIKDVEVTTTHDYQISYKFAWACTNAKCNVVIKRHSRSIDPNKQCCGKCMNKLIEIEVPQKGQDISNNAFTPKKQRKTSEYALFVKKHSASIREKLARERSCSPKEVSQAEVMKECGAEWQRRKQGSSSNPISEIINLTLG